MVGNAIAVPLNFTDVPLQDIVPQAIYNLDLVNQTLAAINHLFVQEHQLPDQRITIRQAVLAALTPTTPLRHAKTSIRENVSSMLEVVVILADHSSFCSGLSSGLGVGKPARSPGLRHYRNDTWRSGGILPDGRARGAVV